MSKGQSSGPFDLFEEDREIPVSGYPLSLAHACNLTPNSKSTLSYDLTLPPLS